MNAPRFTSLRFTFRGERGIGGPNALSLDAQGRFETVTEDDSIRQSIRLLLATRPGERVMRPGYGCNLDQLVFLPNDDTTAGLAMYHVRNALETWEPRIDIVTLDAGPDPQLSELLVITLTYRARSTNTQHQLAVGIDLSGTR